MKLENFQQTNLGDLIYQSESSGLFILHEIATINRFEKSQNFSPFFDCPVTVRSLKDCHFSNVNLIHTENEIFTNNGYHFETPAIDISKFGIKSDVSIKAKEGFYNYPITSKPIKLECGFYIGETDNFGHWIFEFLPKVLWYLRLFPKQDIPLFVGKNVPNRWVDLVIALGVDSDRIEKF